MGQKTDPRAFRLKTTDTWRSRWFAGGKTFAKTLKEDSLIRSYIIKKFGKSGIYRIDLERLNKEINVIVHSTRPGMIIGKGGAGIDEMRADMQRMLQTKQNIKISIEESKNVNLEAKVWADTLAEQIEKRMAYRRAMKNALEQIMDAGAVGVKISFSGRLNGAEIARSEWLYRGKLPLHTIRANIDFAKAIAFTTFGTIGIKVWINKGEIFDKSPEEPKGRRTEELQSFEKAGKSS